MNRSADFTQLDGLWVYQDTLDFMQKSYSDSVDAITKGFGDKLIITGVNNLGGGQVSSGEVIISGERYPFVGGTALANVMIETIITKEQFDNGTQKDVYTTKRVIFSNLSGFPFTDLKRLPFNSATIQDGFKNVQTILKAIINFENEVIIDGCTVGSINTGASTFSVGDGLVMFSGEMVVSPPYNGVYPAYLQSGGTWVTSAPGSGSYITFNPHTSQRYKDVLRRFNYQSGDIFMSKVLTDRFDVGTGLGKWEWLGWKISDDLSGRTLLGYDRRTSGSHEDGMPEELKIWDVSYNTAGNTGGLKAVKLTANQSGLRQHSHGITGDTTDDSGAGGIVVGSPNSPEAGHDTNGAINVDGVNGRNGSQPAIDFHENRQPYRVVAVLERI